MRAREKHGFPTQRTGAFRSCAAKTAPAIMQAGVGGTAQPGCARSCNVDLGVIDHEVDGSTAGTGSQSGAVEGSILRRKTSMGGHIGRCLNMVVMHEADTDPAQAPQWGPKYGATAVSEQQLAEKAMDALAFA